jgi:hypothetical protein
MKRSARVAWLGLLALALAVVYSQTTISPVARAQSEAPASPAAGGNLGTLADFQALFQPLGFTGADSPLPDGTPRWVATDAKDAAMAEAIGPADGLTKVRYTVTVPQSADSSSQLVNLVTFLSQYSLAGEYYVIGAISMAPVQAQDETQTFDNRTVHVTAAQGANGTDVLVEITPTSGTVAPGEPTPTFAFPTFEIPSFSIPSFALPSFASDPALAAKYPSTIDGQPVTNLQTFYFLDILKAFETDAQIQAMSAALGSFGVDLSTVSAGSAKATVDGSEVSIGSLRAPGADANQIIAHYNEIQAAVNTAMGQPVPTSPPTLTQTTLGGKPVTVATDSDGTVTYLYASGDTLFQITDSNDDQAGKVVAALP